MKIRHILKSRDFAEVLQKGDRVKGGMFALYIAKDEAKNLRVGVILPKKQARLAVQRNYLKRLIYAIFREKAGKLHENRTMAVVRLMKDVSGKKRKELSGESVKDLEMLLKKAGIEK